VVHDTAAAATHGDDGYQGFGVPDDLMW